MDGSSDKENIIISVKKGTWSSQEDSLLINYIAIHGEGRWSNVARDSGLRRTGKSCRLRWKNYLQPNVRRGNFTVEEHLCIVELHCIYGNRWSKIAEFFPGRTDNEIKNYWRSRVHHKQAKQLKYDNNSVELRGFDHNINWIPRDVSQQIHVEATGPEALHIDYWASSSEAHIPVGAIDDLSKISGCGPTPSELDFGHPYCGPNSPYNNDYCSLGSDTPALSIMTNYQVCFSIMITMILGMPMKLYEIIGYFGIYYMFKQTSKVLSF